MKVFIVELKAAWRQIREVEVKIVQTPKRVWAELPNGKRRLLGASAFFTIESARRCQKAKLEQLVHSGVWAMQPLVHQYAKLVLKTEYLH